METEKKKEISERIKNYHIGIWFLLIFLISILLCIYIPRYILEGSFEVGANVNYSDETQYFTVDVRKFLQIICLGPIFGVIYYILMRITLSKVDKEVKYKKYAVYLIEIAVVILIVINSMGHLSHLGFEEVNAIDGTEGAALNSDYKEMFVMAWYMDEWFGHLIIQITYAAYIILAVLAELLIDDQERMKIDEFFLTLCAAIGITVINGYAALRSESGLVIMIMQITFSICAIIVILVKKIDPRKYPILLAMLLATIFVVFLNIEWMLTYGVKDYYPYYSSNLK